MVDAADLKSVEPYKLVRVQVSPPPCLSKPALALDLGIFNPRLDYSPYFVPK